jgi:hypothetical protein
MVENVFRHGDTERFIPAAGAGVLPPRTPSRVREFLRLVQASAAPVTNAKAPGLLDEPLGKLPATVKKLFAALGEG